MDCKPYITADPEVIYRAVCLRGTHIPVSVSHRHDLTRT